MLNPFIAAEEVLERIKARLSETSLDTRSYFQNKNPFKNLPKPTLGPLSQLPNVVMVQIHNLNDCKILTLPSNL